MATNQQSGKVDRDRRELLMLGLAGASALVLGESKSLLAASDMGLERKVIKEAESVIPGVPKIRLRVLTFQPGYKGKATMKNSMICEITRGSLESKVDGKPVTRKQGDLYTCRPGLVIENENKGKTVAVMRVLDLLPA